MFSLIAYLKEDNEDFVIVSDDFFSQENAMLLTVGHPDTDWSDNMLLAMARAVTDVMNENKDKIQELFNKHYDTVMAGEEELERRELYKGEEK